MSKLRELTYEEWRKTRIHVIEIGGLLVKTRYVSNQLINKLSSETRQMLSELSNPEIGDFLSRSQLVSGMSKILEEILPLVLVSPMWLTKALEELTEDEIVNLFNAIVYARVQN